MMDVLTDPQSWKDLAWLTFAGTFGFAAGGRRADHGVAASCSASDRAGVVLVVPDPARGRVDVDVDTFGEAFLALDIGLIAAAARLPGLALDGRGPAAAEPGAAGADAARRR